jgi:phytoene synthase
VAGIARQHYREADALLGQRPRGDLRAPRLMSAVYAALLARMESQSWTAPRRRVRVAKTKLLWFVLRYGIVR